MKLLITAPVCLNSKRADFKASLEKGLRGIMLFFNFSYIILLYKDEIEILYIKRLHLAASVEMGTRLSNSYVTYLSYYSTDVDLVKRG